MSEVKIFTNADVSPLKIVQNFGLVTANTKCNERVMTEKKPSCDQRKPTKIAYKLLKKQR